MSEQQRQVPGQVPGPIQRPLIQQQPQRQSKAGKHFLRVFIALVVVAAVCAVILATGYVVTIKNDLEHQRNVMAKLEAYIGSTGSYHNAAQLYLNILHAIKEGRKDMDPVIAIEYAQAITEAVILYSSKGLSAERVLGLIEGESYFDNNIISDMGAVGAMQVMPSTAIPYYRMFYGREPENIIEELKKISVNVKIGCAVYIDYQRICELRWQGDIVRNTMIMYNFGEGSMLSHIKTKGDGWIDTVEYPKDILAREGKWQTIYSGQALR